MENKLIEFKEEEVMIPNDVQQKIRDFKKMEREINKIMDTFKENAKSYMEENDIKELDSPIIKIKYVDGFSRKSVDTARLKAENLYDIYSKETEVKPSVRITIK